MLDLNWQLTISLLCVAAAIVFLICQSLKSVRGEVGGCSGCPEESHEVTSELVEEDQISLNFDRDG